MRFIPDHDFHIHSTLSLCCHDPNQTPQAIFDYGVKNDFKKLCLTNHCWDESVKSRAEWCEEHSFKNIFSVLPLPQSSSTKFLLGVETDMDFDNVLGISSSRIDELDFVIISTTHLHLAGNTVKEKLTKPEQAAEKWLEKIEALLKMELPWNKIGIAHLTCGHIFGKDTTQVIDLLPEKRLYSVFSDCAEKGLGIELNMKTLSMTEEEKKILLRPYYIAKDCGCKFYLGSDSHNNAALAHAKENFENVIDTLDLKESDKFLLE